MNVRPSFLPFCRPQIGPEEIAAVAQVLRSDWISAGPEVRRFELEFASLVGAPAALAVNSGTAALHLALLAVGIGRGDRVITTAMTFCSSVHVIEHVGGEPVLADVQPDTLNIDPEAVRRLLQAPGGDRVKAILPVHLYGHPCDMAALVALAEEHKLAIVEDAAHAVPAASHGRMVGSGWNDRVPSLVAFSFYATKNLTTGEGGMLTGSQELVDAARGWSLHGMSRDAFRRYSADGSWHYGVHRAGFKYNMNDIAATLGLQQMRKLEAMQARRREIVHRYDERFGSNPRLVTPAAHADVEHAWHLYALRLNIDPLGEPEPGRLRARFVEELKARNIGTSVHFIPVHLHEYYRDKYRFAPADLPVAYREYQRIVSLPLYPGMTDGDVRDVIDAVEDALDVLPPRPVTVAVSAGWHDELVPILPEIPGKRMFDVAVAVAVLIVGAPLWVLIAIAIWIESGTPVLHSGLRVGLGGKTFTMFKFRSMIKDAPAKGPAVTLPADPRVTRIGRLLRFMKLDEMPQLFNILRGDLSIVGPRPEDPRYARLYTPDQRRVLSVRPGLTNPAMIKYRHEQELLAAAGGDPEQVYVAVHMPDRLRMDLNYIEQRSFAYDLQILAQAFASLFRRRDRAPVNPVDLPSS